jgi:hypothetical protein
MPIEDSLVAEITTAIDTSIAEKSVDEPTETVTAEVPAAETVVEHEDEIPASTSDETPVVDETDEKPVVVTPTLSNFALESAVRAGLDIDTARSFPNDEALLRIVQKVDAARRPAEVVTPVYQQQEEDPFAKLPKLDPEEFEPKVIEMYDSLVGIVRKQQEQLAAFRSQSEGMARSAQESVAQDVERWFDSKVEELGKDFHETLGKGNYRALPSNSPFVAKRDALADQVAILHSGYVASGRQAPSRDDLFSAAAKLVLANEYEKARENSLNEKLTKRSSQHINRAGGKGSKGEVSPQDAVAAMLDAKFFGKT